MRVIIFSGREPQLLLERVVLDANGQIRSGVVVNGGWELEITPAGEMLAKAGEDVVTSWPLYPDYLQANVPEEWQGGYNEIMGRAAEELLK